METVKIWKLRNICGSSSSWCLPVTLSDFLEKVSVQGMECNVSRSPHSYCLFPHLPPFLPFGLVLGVKYVVTCRWAHGVLGQHFKISALLPFQIRAGKLWWSCSWVDEGFIKGRNG